MIEGTLEKGESMYVQTEWYVRGCWSMRRVAVVGCFGVKLFFFLLETPYDESANNRGAYFVL